MPALALALPLSSMQERGRGEEGGEELDDRLRPLPPSPEPARRAPLALVSDPERERGAPFLVPLADGRAWLGCLEWQAGAGDRIAVREIAPAGAVVRTVIVQEAPAEIVRPVGALDGGGRMCVFWTELVEGAPQIRFARLEGEGFTTPRTLTGGPHPNSNVEAAGGGDGRVWLCWEGFVPAGEEGGRGSVDVLLAPLEGDALATSVRVGDGRASDVDPVIARRGDRLLVAWSRFSEANRDYEIVLREFDPGSSTLAAPVEVSCDGSSDDLHPALGVAGNGDVWIAWDRLVDPTRGTSLPESLRTAAQTETHSVFVMTARIRDGIVELPAARPGWPAGSVAGAPRLSWMGGVPRLAIARDGRPWIAYRYLLQFQQPSGRGRHFGEPVLLHSFGEEGWSPAIEIDESIGTAEEPALAAVAGGVLCVGQQDRRLRAASLYEGASAPAPLRDALARIGVDVCTWFGPTGVFVAHAEAPPGAPAAGGGTPKPASFVPRPDRGGERHFHPSGDALDDPFVNGSRHHEVVQGERRFLAFWGDLHRHSSISRCARGYEPGPSQRYEFGRDVHLYDFMAMTDHSGQIDPFSWWQLDKMCWLFRSPTFCPLAGFECSTQWYGHQNVILDGRIAPLFAWATHQRSIMEIPEGGGLELLYKRLPPDRAITIPHTSADGGRRVPFDQCDPRFTRLIEVYQALRGSYEFEGCLRQSTLASAFGGFAHDALTGGLKLGFVASTDHGNGASYAVALAERLDPASLFEALRSRRTFGATTKGLFVDFRVDDALMGEEVVCRAPPRVKVRVRAPREIDEVVIFRNGRPWRALGRPLAARPDTVTGATIVLDPPFKARGPEKDWTLTLTLEGGEWLAWPLGRRPPRGDDAGRGFVAEGSTLRFRCPAGYFGFKPGQLRVRARARRDAWFTAQAGSEVRDCRFSALFARPLTGAAGRQSWTLTAHERFDDAVDPTKGLGVRELEREWTDEELEPGSAWYYARVVQRDGEMAWSSPVFVTRTRS